MSAALPTSVPKTGLIMSGGGARAAYQVGVLKAITEIVGEDAPNPFPIISGTSAGAINGAALAIYATRFNEGVRRLAAVWGNFHVDQVYRADSLGVLRSGAHWMAALLVGGLGKYNPRSLLNRAPLQDLLARVMPCHEIQRSIEAGALYAFSVTASGYSSGHSVTFFQAHSAVSAWQRARRVGVPTEITLAHLMASSAIPMIFSAVEIEGEYFGDGSMRHAAPISPALHMGAERVLVIGVRQEREDLPPFEERSTYPSFAQIAGHVLNSIFLDHLDLDLERLQRINNTLKLIPRERLIEGDVKLRPVDVLCIAPSEDLTQIAERHARRLPRPVRYLLRGVGGANGNGANLVSYLLFEESYCRELMALGYADTMQRKAQMLQFLGVGAGVPEDHAVSAVPYLAEEVA